MTLLEAQEILKRAEEYEAAVSRMSSEIYADGSDEYKQTLEHLDLARRIVLHWFGVVDSLIDEE